MKKAVKVLGVALTGVLFLTVLLYLLDYDYMIRGLRIVYLKGHTTAYIDDYTEFDNRLIKAGDNLDPWPLHSSYNRIPPTSQLQEINEELETVAFIIIKNDSIWFEHYADAYNENSRTNSFSMAKSITTALLGKAIQEGYITSLEQPVTDFYPGLQSSYSTSLTVGDLASMSSGLNWDEDYYNPFSHTARAYFDQDIRKLVLTLQGTREPGKEFEYLSGNTLMLGMILETATGKNLSTYLSESFWKPLGMENSALWQLDSEESGLEKAYCCIASNARDFARFGKLFKNYGRWNNLQLLDSSFVVKATRPRFKDSPQYGYGFWLSTYKDKDIFYMRGVLGQYVIVVPEDDLIIVRLGHKLIKRKNDADHAPDFFIYIDQTYNMLDTLTRTYRKHNPRE